MYKITKECCSCYTCFNVCRFGAIKMGFPCAIIANKCKNCGKCYEACPAEAIIKLNVDGTPKE